RTLHLVNNGTVNATHEASRIALGRIQHRIVIQSNVSTFVPDELADQSGLATLPRPGHHDDRRIFEGSRDAFSREASKKTIGHFGSNPRPSRIIHPSNSE